MNDPIPLKLLQLTLFGSACAEGYTHGTYKNGDVTVQVTVSEDAIAEVTVTAHSIDFMTSNLGLNGKVSDANFAKVSFDGRGAGLVAGLEKAALKRA